MNSVKLESLSYSSQLAAIMLLLIACTSVVPRSLRADITLTSAKTDRGTSRLTHDDEVFLEDLERRSFKYFWDEADSHTGLVPDRARMDGSALDENHRNVASIAATGFALTALCIAAEHGWISRSQSQERARNS